MICINCGAEAIPSIALMDIEGLDHIRDYKACWECYLKAVCRYQQETGRPWRQRYDELLFRPIIEASECYNGP